MTSTTAGHRPVTSHTERTTTMAEPITIYGASDDLVERTTHE